jgi:uncharacterized membrane protein YGL010W
MSSTQVRVTGTGLLMVVIFLSGLWVTRLGKPYSTFPFTIHKLAGLAVGILLAVIVYQTHKVAPLGAAEIAAIVVTVLCFIGTVVAGGFLSVAKEIPAIVQRLHQVIPVLTLVSTAGTLYLLLRG